MVTALGEGRRSDGVEDGVQGRHGGRAEVGGASGGDKSLVHVIFLLLILRREVVKRVYIFTLASVYRGTSDIRTFQIRTLLTFLGPKCSLSYIANTRPLDLPGQFTVRATHFHVQ